MSRFGDSSRTSSSFLNFKCCVVGDCGVGKTSILMAYCLEDWKPNNRAFIPETFAPTRPLIIPSADSHACITLTIKDTRGGAENGDQLRAYDCAGADCLLICFSVVDPESFFSVETRWLPFMTKTCPDAAVILVGTKTDLRHQQQQQPSQQAASQAQQRRISVLQQPHQQPSGHDLQPAEEAPSRSSRRISVLEVTPKMGEKLAKKIHAYRYIECSSMDKGSLDEVFNSAIRTFADEPSAENPSSSSSAPPRDRTDSTKSKKCLVS